jgi:nickel/cobalt transporter (NicO) family protein
MKKRLISAIQQSRLLWPALLVLCLFLRPATSFAHPMGNFSTSHYSGIRIERDLVEIRYLIDMAEIPTFQEIQQNRLITKSEDASARSYVAKQSEILKAGLVLTLNGQPLPLRTESAEVIFPPGAGGLPTMKMAFVYRAHFLLRNQEKASSGQYALYYRDGNFPHRAGWKEVVANAGSGVTIVNATVPANDRSSQLSNYPTDLLNSPPLNLEATVNLRWEPVIADVRTASAAIPNAVGADTVKLNQSTQSARQRPIASVLPKAKAPGEAIAQNAGPDESGAEKSDITKSEYAPALPLRGNKQSTPQNSFTELMTTKQFSIWFLIVAAAIAAGLGATHALEPGHGKTIVAAYLVGSKGTAYHAFLLGLIVTVSHTASVYALGAITLYASKYIVPEQLYPWLGAISGLLIAAVGSYVFLQRYSGNEVGHSHGPGLHHHHGFGHSHPDGRVHSHDGPEHSAQHSHDDIDVASYVHGDGHGHQHNKIRSDVPYRQLLALGITGGIVPCPAALVVLLSAVALNRVGFGLFLIVAFSVGLAAVLITVGMMMVYARQFMTRFRSEGLFFTRWLPLTSAAVITFLGLGIAIRALITGGILQIRV